jgi:hypothetical protein
MPDFIPTEQDITALLNGDHANEALLRSSGRIGEADQLAATRSTRLQAMRAELGLPEPQAPNPTVVNAAEHGVHLEAKPSDYSKADFSDFARVNNLPADRAANAKSELAGLMASMQIDPNTGAFLMEFVARTGPQLRAMNDTDRGIWVSNQERDATLMAARRGLTLDQMKANAKSMLANHPLGKQIAESALLSTPTILLMLDDHRQFVEAHKKSKGK